MDYFAYVKNTLLTPAGITEAEVRPTAANPAAADRGADRG